MPINQEEAQNTLTQIQQRLDGKNIIAIASGKGGVGKSWFAVTLAHAYALKGEKVLLIDGDLGLSNIDIQLGITPSVDFADIVLNNDPLNLAIIHDDNINCDIITGHSSSQTLACLNEAKLQLFCDDLQILSQHYDKVIIDLASGLQKTTTSLASIASKIIVISTDSPTALSKSYALIEALKNMNKASNISVLINMANTIKEGEHTYQILLKACQSFLNITPPLLGVLRYDTRVLDAVNTQTPLLTLNPSSEIAKDVCSLIEK